jgi:hypothetical protein
MKKSYYSILEHGVADQSLTRAMYLAEMMARVLDDEVVSDASFALALLTGGMVTYYATDAMKVNELICAIRTIEDRLLARAMSGELQ